MTTPVPRLAVSLLPLLIVGCSRNTLEPTADGGATVDGAAIAGCHVVARTCAEVIATFSSGAKDVTVTCDEAAGTFTLRSTGVPNYPSNQTTPNAIKDQMWVVVFPLRPTCAAATTNVVDSRGPIGFMINGVPFYGPQDAQGRDAVVFEGPTFDDCAGHADPSCSYHYHEEPVCVFGLGMTAAQRPLPDGHSPVIGYAFDGFAVYASPNSSPLDACNGHSDGTRGYHYHATKALPYLMACYQGKSSATMMHVPACFGMMMPMGDGGMAPPVDGGAKMGCGAGCQNGQVCCPAPEPCAGMCVPDCRKGPGCPPMRTCDQVSGVCK